MMNPHWYKRPAAVLLAAAMLTAGTALPGSMPAQAAQSVTIANPVIWSDVPDDDIIRVGDTYYMVSTTMFFSPGAPIMKSKDLVSWEICNYVYDTYANGDKQTLTGGAHDYAHGQWAASLRYKDGVFYVFFGSYGTGNSYIYKTTDIENGTWTRSEIRGMYHDASMLLDEDGRNYLVYGGGGEIKLRELNAEMTDFKSGSSEQTIIRTGLDNLAGEGSHIQKIGDYYYVFLIAWPSGSGRIELCYRSKNVAGPYEGKTVLNSGLGTYGSGVAQGGIVQTPDGDWYGLLFQDHGSVGRVPVLVPVNWQDGWPMMGINGKAPTTLTFTTDYTGAALARDDDFSYTANKLALEWQWNHNPDNNAWSVTEREGWLRLHNAHTAQSILHARNTLTMRTEGPACSGAVRLDTRGMKPGDCAGLSAFQFNYGNIGVRVDDSGTKYVYMAKNAIYSNSAAVMDSYDKIIEQVPMQGDTVCLKAAYRFGTVDENYNVLNNIDKVDFYYSFDGSNWTKLGDTLSMTYDLKLFTGYRNALYSYSTKSTGGYADFDYFDYERDDWNVPTVIEPDANGYYFHDTFEGSTGDWTARGPATILTSGRTAYAGSEALLTMDRASAWNGASLPLSRAFVPGQTYSFSVNAEFLDGADYNTFYMKLQYKDGEGTTQYATVAEGGAVRGDWVQLANPSYTIPADATDMYLYVETASGKDNFYIDEAIGAVEGTVIAGAGAGRVLRRGDLNGDGIINVIDLTLAKAGVRSGFSDTFAQLAADVDRSETVDAQDVAYLADFITRRITEFPVNEPEKPTEPESDFAYDAALSYHEAPSEYLRSCAQEGRIINETYNGINGSNKLNVYLPYGYDPDKKYNIFYLMHGGSENENTIFSEDVKLSHILDRMIMNGELEQMIVVTPTFNKSGADKFYEELRQSVIPFVEGKYSTYAASTSEADLQASRMHRAYGGFSMGALSVWCVADHDMDLVGYFMPLSGNNWEGMNNLTAEIDKLGLKQNEYFILGATGTNDMAYGNMKPEMEDLKTRTKYFTYTSDFSKGNFYWLVADGREHWWGHVRYYVYDALPYFFHEG